MDVNDKTLTEITATGITLVDFWAEWCGPCKAMGPIIEELAAELANDPIPIRVVKANIDETPATARAAGVRSVPAFAVYKDGKQVAVKTGQMPKASLATFARAHAA